MIAVDDANGQQAIDGDNNNNVNEADIDYSSGDDDDDWDSYVNLSDELRMIQNYILLVCTLQLKKKMKLNLYKV